jgi:hypothetical protein
MSTDIEVTVTPAVATISLEVATGVPGPQGPQGPAGANGSDASVTSSNIVSALGYTPASVARALAFSIAL